MNIIFRRGKNIPEVIFMDDSQNREQPMPKNGKKVNDWETLRPYVEEAAPPSNVYLENLSDSGTEFGPNWNLEHNNLEGRDLPKKIEPKDLQDI